MRNPTRLPITSLSNIVPSNIVPSIVVFGLLLLSVGPSWAQPASRPASEPASRPVSSRPVATKTAPKPPKIELTPPSVAPPSVAPPSVAPPSVAPPSVAPPSVAAKKGAAIRLSFRPGKGLVVRTADGRFSLSTRLRGQFLYTVEDGPGDTEQSLQIRRARLAFGGNFYGKHNHFKIEFAISPKDDGLGPSGLTKTPLLNWFMDFTYLRDLNFRIGQFKVPYSRQRVLSSSRMQLVDRSIVNGEFNLDRDIALSFFSRDLFGSGMLAYYLTIGVGEGRDGFRASDFGMLYIARVELNPFGRFKDYSEGDLAREKRFRLSVGAAYSYLDRGKKNRGIVGSTPADGGTTDTHNANVDVMAKWRGLSLLAAWMWRKGSRNPGDAMDGNGQRIPVEAVRDGQGVQAQIGYVHSFPLEVAARWATVWGKDSGVLKTHSELGGGLNYYFAGHPFKLQADFFYYWNGTRFRGDDREQRFRLQLQASF